MREKLLGQNALAALLLLVFGVVTLIGTAQIMAPPSQYDRVGPSAVPIVVGVSLLLMGGVLTIRVLNRPPLVGNFGDLKIFVVVTAANLGYLLILPYLGFTVTSALFLAVLFRFLGAKRLWVAIVGAVVSAVLIYVLFHIGLTLQLPTGIVGF